MKYLKVYCNTCKKRICPIKDYKFFKDGCMIPLTRNKALELKIEAIPFEVKELVDAQIYLHSNETFINTTYI